MATRKQASKQKRFGPSRNSLLSAQQIRGRRIYNIWKHYSARNGKDVILKSDAEFDHFCWVEGDEEISSYELEPEPLVVLVNNQPTRTQFDALCMMRTGSPKLREISDNDELLDARKLLQREAQIEAARRIGYEYERITRETLEQHSILIDNWRRALSDLSACRHLVLQPLCDQVMRILERHSPCALEAVLCDTDPVYRSNYLAAIFRCLQRGQLRSDLSSKPLSARSLVWLPKEKALSPNRVGPGSGDLPNRSS
jgi:hypothetical protein